MVWTITSAGWRCSGNRSRIAGVLNITEDVHANEIGTGIRVIQVLLGHAKLECEIGEGPPTPIAVAALAQRRWFFRRNRPCAA